MHRVTIRYSIPDSQWQDARDAVVEFPSPADEKGDISPLDDVLFGGIEIGIGESTYCVPKEGLAPDRFATCLLGVTHLLVGHAATPSFPIELEQEDLFKLVLTMHSDGMRVSTRSGELGTVGLDEWIIAVEEFASQFVGEVRDRAPEILEWKATQALQMNLAYLLG